MPDRSFIAKIAVLMVLGALILPGQSPTRRRAPGFSLPDMAFQQHDLMDYRGRWLLLFFIRTEVSTSNTVEQLLEARKSQAAVLTVGVSPIENQAKISKFVADTKITTPVVFDQGQMAASYFNATPTRPSIDLPHLFAINPNGLIVADWTEAAMKEPTFASQLDAALRSKK